MWHMGGIKTSKIPLALSWEIEIQHPVIATKYNQSIEISTSWTQIEDTYSSHGDFSITQAKKHATARYATLRWGYNREQIATNDNDKNNKKQMVRNQ